MNLTGKTVVLTGAAGGIGCAIAQSMSALGARLILVGRDPTRLEQLRASLPGTEHLTVAADLGANEGRQQVAGACASGVDILVNAAGVNYFGLLQEQSEQQIVAMIQINTVAPILLTQLLLPALSVSKGTVVNVGSGFGSIGFAGYCGYSASKFALRGFSEALRRELSGTGVDVLYLAPRAVDTAMNSEQVVGMNAELGNKADSPQTVAQELLRQLESAQPRRFLGWPERFFVKLNAMFPSIVDSALAKQLPVIRKWALAGSSAAG